MQTLWCRKLDCLTVSLSLVIHTELLWDWGQDSSHQSKTLLSLPDSWTGSDQGLVAFAVIARVTWIHGPANHCCIRSYKEYRSGTCVCYSTPPACPLRAPPCPPRPISAGEVAAIDKREVTFLHAQRCGPDYWVCISDRQGKLVTGKGWGAGWWQWGSRKQSQRPRSTSYTFTQGLGVNFRWNECPDLRH